MGVITVIIIAIGLSMDSFAVSVAVAPCMLKLNDKLQKFKFAVILAVVQGAFTIFGWLSGNYIEVYLNGLEHCIAFAILLIIGVKMIIDGFKTNKKPKAFNTKNVLLLLGLGVVTSIDAFFVGISISLIHFNVFYSAAIISLVTFIFAIIGIELGNLLKRKIRISPEIIGGIILIGIGAKILAEFYN